MSHYVEDASRFWPSSIWWVQIGDEVNDTLSLPMISVYAFFFFLFFKLSLSCLAIYCWTGHAMNWLSHCLTRCCCTTDTVIYIYIYINRPMDCYGDLSTTEYTLHVIVRQPSAISWRQATIKKTTPSALFEWLVTCKHFKFIK